MVEIGKQPGFADKSKVNRNEIKKKYINLVLFFFKAVKLEGETNHLNEGWDTYGVKEVGNKHLNEGAEVAF